MRAMTVFRQLIAPPTFDDDSKTRLAALLHPITLGLAALAVLYVVVFTLVSFDPLALVFGFVIFGLCMALNVLVRWGYTRAAALGLATSLWLVFTLATSLGSSFGVFDTSFSGYIIPIMIAGFLLGGRMGVFFALLSAASGAVILIVHSNTQPPPFTFSRSLAQWIGQSVLFLAAAYLLALTRRNLTERNEELRREVAERQRIEKALRDQGARLVIALRAGGLESWVLDAQTLRFSYPDADPEDSATFPKNLDAFLNRLHADDRESVKSTIEQSIRDQTGFELEYRYYAVHGASEWYYTKADVYEKQDGSFGGLYGLSYDITLRRKAEDAIRDSEAIARRFQERLKALHEVSIELSQAGSLDDLYRQAVALGQEKLGFGRLALFRLAVDPNVVVGTYGIDPRGRIRDEHNVRFALGNNKMVVEALNSHLHVLVQHHVELWDYTTVVGRGWNAMALLWNEANPIGWLAADNLLDKEPLREEQLELLSLYGAFLGPLILKKQAEMEVQRHQERLRLALKAAQMRTWDWSLRSDQLIADEPETFGLRTATRIEDFYRQVHPEDRATIRSAIDRATTDNVPYTAEYRLLSPSGRTRWIFSLGQVYRDDAGNVAGITGVSQDITERKQAEERFFKSFHAAPLPIAISSFHDGRYIEVNEQWLRLLGYSRDETIGHTSVELGFWESADIRRMMVERFNEQGFLRDVELLAGGKDRKVPLLMLAEKVELGGEICFLTMLQDISGRKEVEKQALELALQRERNALLTEFMSNMSHDIKTPLTAINTGLYLLERTDDKTKQRERLDAIRAQTLLVEKFIQDILTISRLDYAPDLELKPVVLNSLLRDIQARLRPTVEKKNLSLTLELDPTATPVWGDADELDRAMVNLVENAVNYTPVGGSVRVHTFVAEDCVVAEVADSGIGIDPVDIPNIFNRFYRAASARSTHDGGTGLGLAIVKKIVEMHHGSIEVESLAGQGSIFRMRLPPAEIDRR